MIRTNITITSELKEQAHSRATAAGLNLSLVIRLLLAMWLAGRIKLEPTAKWSKEEDANDTI